jgi:hypothetical protein
MRYLVVGLTLALAPMQAGAQCASETQTVAQVASAPSGGGTEAVITVAQHNAAVMKAALGEDDSHATDADLE